MGTRIGIIGTRWGRMHVGGFRAAGAEITALCGRDAARTREVAAAEGIPLGTTDLAELCAACDAVVVASPDALHQDHVAQALRAGRPVLCEKPLTRTAAAADALLTQEAASGVVCAVSFPYRMLPPIAALHRALRERSEVRQVAVVLRSGFLSPQDAGEGDGDDEILGASGDFGGVSHVLDAALWLLDAQPARVQSVLTGRPVHSAALHVELQGGAVLGITHLAAPEPGIWGRWTLVGRDWEASFAAGYRPELGGWRVGPVQLFSGARWHTIAPELCPQSGAREPWAEAHVETARAFLARMQGAPGGSLATFADGARVQHVIDAAVRSEREQRRIRIACPAPIPI